MNFEDYYNEWLNGLESEIEWWRNYMNTEGLQFFYSFEKTTSPYRRFELEEDIPLECYGKPYKFIDVGSGPFSRCGHITDKVQLDVLAVDPLAEAYNKLKNLYGLDTNVHLQTGFAELLEYEFEPNSFDMVHMSNSLDHSFSPLDGIYQLLNICKIGGKIILRHTENEAENENYIGLHQWNLSLHNEENSFVIWRGETRYNVCEIFREYVEFELIPDVLESDGHWIYNKVVMIKKKDIQLPENRYYKSMFSLVYRSFIYEKYKLVEKKDLYGDNGLMFQRISLIRENFHNKGAFERKLINKGICSVIIYGMGEVGNNLEYLLNNCKNVRLLAKLDIKGSKSGCVDAIKLSEYNGEKPDIVVVTIERGFDKVCADIKKSIPDVSLCTIEEFLS